MALPKPEKTAVPPDTDPGDQSREPEPTIAPASSRAYVLQSLVVASGWLCTNLALQIGNLPLKFVLKDELGLTAPQSSGFFAIGNSFNYVKPLAGVLCDSVPLWGSRRRSYLLTSLLLTGLFWMVLSWVPRHASWMLPAYFIMYFGVVFTSTALGGVMVEVGARFRAAGRLTAQRIGMFKLAELTGAPIGGLLGKSFPFAVPAVIAGLLHLGLIPVLMKWLPPEDPAPSGAGTWTEVRRQFQVLVRSKTLWGAAGMIFLMAAAPGLNTPLFYYQTNVLKFDQPFVGFLVTVMAAAGILAATAYYPACRKLDLRMLSVMGILAHAAGALGYLGYHDRTSALLISALAGAASTLTMLPVYDIAARATPKGSEAIGYAVMMSVWNLTSMLSDLIGSNIFKWVGSQMAPLIWIDAGTTLLALFAVPFMPGELTRKE